MDTHEDSPGVTGLLYEFSFDDVLVGGGAFDAPVILEQNHIAKQLFPSEIPEMWYISGRATKRRPYGVNW